MENREEQGSEAEQPQEMIAQSRRRDGRRVATRALSALAVLVVALLVGLFIGFLGERAKLQGRVARGVEAEGIALQGLTQADLPLALSPLKNRLNARKVTLTHGERVLETTSLSLGFGLNLDALVVQALAQGRRGSLLTQFLFFARSLFSPSQLLPQVMVDEKELVVALEAWTSAFLSPPVEPSLSYVGQLQVNYSAPGETANVPALRALLMERLLGSAEPIALELPTTHIDPKIDRATVDERAEQARLLLSAPVIVFDEETSAEARLKTSDLGNALSSELIGSPAELSIRLDAEKIRASLGGFLAEVERKVKDASFEVDSRGKVTIVPSEPGVRVDELLLVERLLELGKKPSRKVAAPKVGLQPRRATAQAEALGITGLVSTFTTYHECCQPRVDNIHAVAEKIDGVVVPPGETFSLNDFLGPRIGNSDYKSAPTIVHGEMQETTGGGISQFATTFFNALLDGGYAIVQRQPHSFYFTRYPEGHEATISFPAPDLIFKNDTDAGVLIKTQFSGTFIKVSLYGDNGGRKSFRHKSKRYNYVKPPIEYEADPEMDPEKQKRLRAGQTGWSLVVSRTIVFPDKSEKKEQREVVYNPRPELIRTHPCNIPEGEKGHTGEKCPEPERDEREEVLSEDEYFETVRTRPALREDSEILDSPSVEEDGD